MLLIDYNHNSYIIRINWYLIYTGTVCSEFLCILLFSLTFRLSVVHWVNCGINSTQCFFISLIMETVYHTCLKKAAHYVFTNSPLRQTSLAQTVLTAPYLVSAQLLA